MFVTVNAAQAILFASIATSISAAPALITVGKNDVILYGNGRLSVMKREEVAELEAARNSGTPPPKPGYLDENLVTYTGNETNISMSQVVKGAPTSISISSGYSISNTISVGVSSQLTLIKDFLSVTMHVDYSQSWQSTQSQQFQVSVPEGKYGAFVSNPWTNRASGNVWTGTIGGEGSLTYYQGDSFESKKFGDMEWVDGVISLCTGDSFPLKRCLGEGTL